MAYPDLKLEIDGYTDSTGTAQYNEVLSQKRAASVRDFLISQGVPVNNVMARGFGESDPIASNATAQGRQLNRRVEMVVSGTAIGKATQPGTVLEPGTTATGSENSGGVSGTAAQPASSGASTPAPAGAVASPAAAPPTAGAPATSPANSGSAPGNVPPM